MNLPTAGHPVPACSFGNVPDGYLRVGPIMHIGQILSGLNVDPESVFASVGISGNLFSSPENTISLPGMGQLFERSVEATGCQHLGLLVGMQAPPTVLGMLSDLLPHCADVGTALVYLQDYFFLHDRSAIVTSSVDGPFATLGYAMLAGQVPGSSQIYAAAIGIGINIMRALHGPRWKPSGVYLACRRPVDVRPYRQALQCPVTFDAEFTALLFPSRDLARPVASADSTRMKALKEMLDTVVARHDFDFPGQVRRTIQSLVLQRKCSLDRVASTFGMHARSVNRMLAQAGTTYRDLKTESIRNIALRLIADTDISLAEISEVLGYAEASVLAHAFKRWTGMSPSMWRDLYAASHESGTSVVAKYQAKEAT